jgi:hypothetical protein
LCSEVVCIVLPEKSQDVSLTRSQAARLIWAAWRAKQIMCDSWRCAAPLRPSARQPPLPAGADVEGVGGGEQ